MRDVGRASLLRALWFTVIMQSNMQRNAYAALTMAVFVWVRLAPTSAQNGTPVTLGVDLDFRTQYLFAGVPFSSGEVIQGSIHLGYGSWTFNAFTNYDLKTDEINEGDIWGDYYHQFNDLLGGFVGTALYNFRIGGVWEPTPELYGGIVLAVPGTPTLYFARDFDLTTGDHAVLTLSHSIPADNVSVQATGRIEYNNGYYRFDPDRLSFSYADLNVSVPIALPVDDYPHGDSVRAPGG